MAGKTNMEKLLKALAVLFMLLVGVICVDDISRSWMVFILGCMALCVLTFEEYKEEYPHGG
jgi:hypothetical protein